jgi:hypothetical protein
LPESTERTTPALDAPVPDIAGPDIPALDIPDPDIPALDIPGGRGGWWHEYVCPAHGTELLPARDGSFPCPHGCLLTGEPYAGAWAVLAHQRAARSLRRLAVIARTGGRPDGAVGGDSRAVDQPSTCDDLATRAAAADRAIDGLCRYAELHRRLATEIRTDVQPWMLAGKLFQQALTEAIWGTSVALAVQTLAGVVPAERLRPAAELLRSLRSGARDARAALIERDDFAGNYTAWLNAAGASASRALALLGEPDETETWVHGRHGLTEHLAVAVHPDGWEWEGSSYYHVFVLRAYLLTLRGRGDLLTDRVATRLGDMVTVLATLATDRGAVIPALHDTPYGDHGWDEELYELCLLAEALPGTPDLGFVAAPLAERLPAGIIGWRRIESRAWLGATGRMMVYTGPLGPSCRAARLFPDAGYAVLRGGGCRAVLDLGPHGGSHGHLDKLALYIYGASAPWQPAFGVPPYGHPWRREYYRATSAHPTLTVDGQDQREATGRLLYWHTGDGHPDDPLCEVGAEADVFPGVSFERHVRADIGHLIDVVRVQAPLARRFELHLRTDVDVTVRSSALGAQTRWPGDGEMIGLHTALCSTDHEPVAASLSTGADLGPADDPQRSRPHLRWRAHAESAVFASVYAPAGSAPSGLHLERSGTGLTVHVDLSGGRTIRWPIPQDVPRQTPEQELR